MKVIEARNVHHALPLALSLLDRYGTPRGSRNGPVLVAPWPVTTVYRNPTERVLFWPQRDANPFFHLYESLWMLAGRKDLAPLLRYVADFGKFSDDGVTLHGAYGYRWRTHGAVDQLAVIAGELTADPDDRRSVLQMWDVHVDLARRGKDVPCNLLATFQRDAAGCLDLTVFCRSNDLVWGAYGANAVHFSMLLEYMALWVGCPVGVYRQVSVNWHAYTSVLDKVASIAPPPGYASPVSVANPYETGAVRALPLTHQKPGESPMDTIDRLDSDICELLMHADTGFKLPRIRTADDEPFIETCYRLFRAHEYWRTEPAQFRFESAEAELVLADQTVDWVVAAREWVARRRAAWQAKTAMEGVA